MYSMYVVFVVQRHNLAFPNYAPLQIGETVLHAAAERCNLDVVKYLVEKQNMEITAENQVCEDFFSRSSMSYWILVSASPTFCLYH